MWQNMLVTGSRFHLLPMICFKLALICYVLAPDSIWQNVFLNWLPIPSNKIFPDMKYYGLNDVDGSFSQLRW